MKFCSSITYKVNVPPREGEIPILNIMEFDREKTKKKIIKSLGLDPKITDDELKETKISFGLSFRQDEKDMVPAYDIVENEIKIEENSIIHINELYKEDYDKQLFAYNNGYVKEITVELPLDPDKRIEKLNKIKLDPNFIEIIDETDVSVNVFDYEDSELSELEYSYFQLGDYAVVINKQSEEEFNQVVSISNDFDMKLYSCEYNDIKDQQIYTVYQLLNLLYSDFKANQEIVNKLKDDEVVEFSEISEDDIFSKLMNI